MSRSSVAYCPNRQGPQAVGMKKAVLAASKSGARQTLRKSPRVTLCGRHSSPLLCRPPSSSVSLSESGATVASMRAIADSSAADPNRSVAPGFR